MLSQTKKPAPWGPRPYILRSTKAWWEKRFLGSSFGGVCPFWADNPVGFYKSDIADVEDNNNEFFKHYYGLYIPTDFTIPEIKDGRSVENAAHNFALKGYFYGALIKNIFPMSGISNGDQLIYFGIYSSSTSYSYVNVFYESATQLKLVIRYYSGSAQEYTYYLTIAQPPWDIYMFRDGYYFSMGVSSDRGVTRDAAYYYMGSSSGSERISVYSKISMAFFVNGKITTDNSKYWNTLNDLYDLIAPPILPLKFVPLDASALRNAYATGILDSSGAILGNTIRGVSRSVDPDSAEGELTGGAFISYTYSRTLEATLDLSSTLNIGIPFIETDGSLETSNDLSWDGLIKSYSKNAEDSLTSVGALNADSLNDAKVIADVMASVSELYGHGASGFNKAADAFDSVGDLIGMGAGYYSKDAETALVASGDLLGSAKVSVILSATDLGSTGLITGQHTPVGSVNWSSTSAVECLASITGQPVISVVFYAPDED